MKVVEADIKLTKQDLLMLGRSQKVLELQATFLKSKEEVELECVFKLKKKYKTNEQLAYFWGVLVPKLWHLYKSWGWSSYGTKERFVEYRLKTDVGFVDDVVNEETGEVVNHVPKSLAGCSTGELSELIDKCIMSLVENGIYVMTPKEYRQKRRM